MKRKALIILCGVLAISLSSCVTSSRVRIETNVVGSEIKIDGKKVGNSPVTVTLSNAFWNDPVILISKDGYLPLNTTLKKQIKPINLIFGLTIWEPSLIWCYGPADYQYFELLPRQTI
jgi:hypothetical protein